MEARPLLRAAGALGQRIIPAGGGQTAETETTHESSLPDIYLFSSLGMSLEGGRYSFAPEKPTPFIPSSPRVAQNQIFNFDHGALDAGIVELTSYMAWF